MDSSTQNGRQTSPSSERETMDSLEISPGVFNSAGPWATTLAQMQDLYSHPATGAITTRTCTLNGFPDDKNKHRYLLFDVVRFEEIAFTYRETAVGSLNSLGYSPLSLSQTLQDLESITRTVKSSDPKTIIISITGPVEELTVCIDQIAQAQKSIRAPLFVEINLSCPNIPGKPPPAYDAEGLIECFTCLRDCTRDATAPKLRFGIKTPPYSNPQNFEFLEQALLKFVDNDTLELPLQFITATNTLGCSLIFDDDGDSILSTEGNISGIGGMAGAPLHALALGNVHLIRKMLSSHKALAHIQIIGVGGVSDRHGVSRMRNAGADFVGIGTALIRNGLRVFDNMLREEMGQES
jgi:dihydroorotate dehydrogenase (fumarate)